MGLPSPTELHGALPTNPSGFITLAQLLCGFIGREHDGEIVTAKGILPSKCEETWLFD